MRRGSKKKEQREKEKQEGEEEIKEEEQGEEEMRLGEEETEEGEEEMFVSYKKLIELKSIEDIRNESVDLKKSVDLFPDTTDSNMQAMQCNDLNTGISNVQQDLRLFEDYEKSIDSRSIVDISNESVYLKKSVELFPDKTDLNIQAMQLYESNIDMYNIEQNVQLSENDKYFVIENGPPDTNYMHESMLQGCRIMDIATRNLYDESIEESVSEAGSQSDVMDSESDTRVMKCQTKNQKDESTCDENVIKNPQDAMDFVIENSPLYNGIEKNLPIGRRIVDLHFLINELHRTFETITRKE